MANHVRRQIREAVKTLLTGLPTTGSRVFTNRLQRIDDADLPCLIINYGNEEIIAESVHYNPPLARSLPITIKAYAQANSGFDDVADEMIKEVEAVLSVAVFDDAALSALAKNLQLQSIDEPEFDGDGAQPVAQVSMQYLITYYTQASTPDISI